MRRNVWSDYVHLSVSLSVGTSICPYGIAYRRILWIGLDGSFQKSMCGPGPAERERERESDKETTGYEPLEIDAVRLEGRRQS